MTEELSKIAGVYMVIGANYHWGRAATVWEARQKARNPRQWLAYAIHPDTTIDDCGGMSWPHGSYHGEYAPVLIDSKPKPKKRKGD